MAPKRDEILRGLSILQAGMRHCNRQLSEMLRRLALCFMDASHYGQTAALVARFNQVMVGRFTKLVGETRNAYDYYAAWKVNDRESSRSDCTPDTGFQVALHSLQRHLKAAALISQEFADDDRQRDSCRLKLKHECQAIATCCELIEAELLKCGEFPADSPSPPVRPMQRIATDCDAAADEKKALPLYGDWQPAIEDEILEADLQHELVDSISAVDDDVDVRESREERLARKQERAAQSKRLYNELQVVLKSKADEWKVG